MPIAERERTPELRQQGGIRLRQRGFGFRFRALCRGVRLQIDVVPAQEALVPVEQRALQQPVQRALRSAQQLRREGHGGRGGQGADGLADVAHGARDDEPLLRARHGHVQQAHLLRERLGQQLRRDRLPRDGRVFHAVLEIRALRPETEHRVHEHALACVGFVEQARRVAQKHERELQPLGFVDAQDAHAAALAAGGGGLHTLGLLPLHPEQETVQPTRTRLFKLLRKIEQEQHIAPPQLAVRHRARERHDGAVVHDVPQKFAQRQLDRQRAVAREHVEKVPAVVACLGGERDRGVKIMLAVARAHGGQIVRRQAEQRRAQRRDERHILVRIVHHRQQRAQHRHLLGHVEPAARLRRHGDAMRLERGAVHGADAVGIAQQDDRVAIVRGALSAVFPHGRTAVDERADAPRDVVCLQRGLFRRGRVVVRVRQLEHGKLRLFAVVRVACSGTQAGRVVIVQLAERAGHDVGKDVVGPFQHRAAGAEIFPQEDAPRRTGRGCAKIRKARVFLEEDRGVGEAEAVDRLLDVADEKEVAALARHGAENEVLHLRHVLIFIDHDLGIAPRELARQLRRRAVVVREQLRGHVLEIGEVHKAAPPLFGGVGRAEVQRQRQQCPHGRGRRVQVGERLRGGDVDLLLQRLDGLFRRVALRLDAVAHVRVRRLARAAEARKRHVLQRRHGSIPAPVAGVRERAQTVGRGRKAVAVDVHKPLHVLVRHDVELRLKHAAPVLRTLAHACQQRPAPRRGAGVGHAVEREQVHLLRGPLLGPRVALHLVVEREHELAQARIVAPAADRVGQQAEGRVGVDVHISALERVFERRRAQGGAALGIGDLKVRCEGEGCAVGAQEVGAEAVDRADLGAGAQRDLPPQAAVFGV